MIFEKPIEAVFISDLHLNPQEPLISSRFKTFIRWAALNTKSVYILGDFFHVWAGDDALDAWSASIATDLNWLAKQGVSLFYMHGNRDFLLGKKFGHLASLTFLAEPTVIQIENQPILLVHGDRYCTQDKAHQWFRRFTRNRCFIKLFLSLPLKWRLKLVKLVREHSQGNQYKTEPQMDVVLNVLLKHMSLKDVRILIHGHTHKPGLRNHLYNNNNYSQFVLSDWDDNPKLLCYYRANGFKFIQYVLDWS